MAITAIFYWRQPQLLLGQLGPTRTNGEVHAIPCDVRTFIDAAEQAAITENPESSSRCSAPRTSRKASSPLWNAGKPNPPDTDGSVR